MAPAIGLINGQQLLDKLKGLSFGVRTRKAATVQVRLDGDWFTGI